MVNIRRELREVEDKLLGQSFMHRDAESVSKNTVDRHRQNIMGKLCVGNSVEAIKVARELELL